MTATVVLAAWAFAFAAVWVAWETSERRATTVRVWCRLCQRHVHQDLTEHLMAAGAGVANGPCPCPTYALTATSRTHPGRRARRTASTGRTRSDHP